jgi:hypothetical protein
MKKTALLLAAIAVGASAQAQDEKRSYSVTSDFTYSTAYIFRGVKINDAEAFQPSIEVAFGDANEIDLYTGYKYKINDAFSLEAVGTYYWYPEANGTLTQESFEAGLGATYTASGISLSLYSYYDFTLEAHTTQASVGYSVPLEMAGASLDFSAFFGGAKGKDWAPNTSARIEESYTYYGLDISLPYKLSETATVTGGIHWAQNENYFINGANDETWFTLGLTVGF